jgi:dTDP-4-dehydrorhamnose 3,5-epimerase
MLTETNIAGLYMISLEQHADNRGSFVTHYQSEVDSFSYLATEKVLQTSLSYSRQNVLRGMHFGTYPKGGSTMVSCAYGSVLDQLVDVREESPTFGQIYSMELNSNDSIGLVFPAGIAHGFLALQEMNIISYHFTYSYDEQFEKVFQALTYPGLKWPSVEYIRSNRDIRAKSYLDTVRST